MLHPQRKQKKYRFNTNSTAPIRVPRTIHVEGKVTMYTVRGAKIEAVQLVFNRYISSYVVG